jgi:hypothetical protein
LPRMAQLIGRGMNPPRQRGGLADLAEITHTDPTT